MAQHGRVIQRPGFQQDGMGHGAAGLVAADQTVALGLLAQLHVLGHGKSVQHHDADALQSQDPQPADVVHLASRQRPAQRQMACFHGVVPSPHARIQTLELDAHGRRRLVWQGHLHGMGLAIAPAAGRKRAEAQKHGHPAPE
ncbi:hypothetical protein [Azohydromonas lata]|uniref:Uncharacterized protein n=1 Tax=Azohydromonas lata TaxID=45677 RepID=A0ABU5IRS7_9BURK|nr:hypothetical protein [Azohydromonas lata]MDZ5461603.1 hypothetical protein [Azohydromonas lata]